MLWSLFHAGVRVFMLFMSHKCWIISSMCWGVHDLSVMQMLSVYSGCVMQLFK